MHRFLDSVDRFSKGDLNTRKTICFGKIIRKHCKTKGQMNVEIGREPYIYIANEDAVWSENSLGEMANPCLRKLEASIKKPTDFKGECRK